MANTKWPSMTNKALAAVMERGAARLAAGQPMTAHQLAALDEAIERIRERGDEEAG